MVTVEHHHGRVKHSSVAPELRFLTVCTSIGQTRENLGEFTNISVVVGGDWPAIGIQFLGTVRVQLVNTDGEELHDLTGVIFIGEGIGIGISLTVVDVA